MVTVRSQAELKSAMEKKERNIRIVGPFAQEVIEIIEKKKKKVKKGALIAGGALEIGGVLAAPFTGGTSLTGTVAGLTMTGLTIGAVTISATELAIICGTVVAVYGIYKGAKVKMGYDTNTKIPYVDIDASKLKTFT